MAGCPSCDRDLSAPGLHGHVCYTYTEHAAKQLANQGESNAPRTFASAPTRVSDLAREVAKRMDAHLAGMPLHLSRHLEHAAVSVDPGTGAGAIFLPQHSLEAEQAMATELVACTLGARSRPELLPREPWA